MITINKESCKGCKLCIKYCPKKFIELSTKVNKKGYFYAVYNEGCINCKFCALICPDACIEILDEKK
jgi:2-oxoglutarate ferredoxin oxidoreductase subunit delta